MKAPGASHPPWQVLLLKVGPVAPEKELAIFGKTQSKKTVEQHADKVAGDTPLRSIEVGTEDMAAVGACDGFPCTFFNSLSGVTTRARCRWHPGA